MDFWVFVAAASAGCLAKKWQSASVDRCSASKLSSGLSNYRDAGLQSNQVNGLTRRKKIEKGAPKDAESHLNDEIFSVTNPLCSVSSVDETSTSGEDSQTSLGNLQESNAIPDSTMEPSTNEANVETKTTDEIGGNICNSMDVQLGEIYREVGTNHGSTNKQSLRSRYLRGRLVKPLTSLESCLMAQLYNHHAELETLLLNSRALSTSPPIRPLLVTDGSHVISRLGDASLGMPRGTEVKKLQKKSHSEKIRSVLGVPLLPNIGVPDMAKAALSKSRKEKILGSSGRISDRKNLRLNEGSIDGTVLLCLGISLGIMISSIENKKDLAKVKESLKQTENLVQDLQEELEMRDSLTVKELASENYESQDTHEDSLKDTLPEHCMNCLAKYEDEEPRIEREGRSPDSMTKIEAELELELERLGLNMKNSNLGRRLSDVELDPDFEMDFAQGELRDDAFSRRAFAECETNRDSGSASTTHSANYAVSPQELSLRLHEVIQSRLEERIEELEVALQNSQRKLQRTLSSASKSSGGRKLFSPAEREISEAIVQPLVMNLSGEALNAYEEACEELMKFESEEDDSPLDLYEIRSQECLNTCQGGEENGSKLEFRSYHQEGAHEDFSRLLGSNDVCVIDYESSDNDEEREKMLIRQIVERTKKGSPVVVNALLSIDEDGE